jgi:hypothetical protein
MCTSTEVARVSRVTWGQLRYATELGRLADCKERDEKRRRVRTTGVGFASYLPSVQAG